MAETSPHVREYLRFAAIIPGVTVILFPLFWHLGGDLTMIVVGLCCAASARYAQTIQKAHPDEVRPTELPLRRRAFGITKWTVLAMFVVFAVDGAISRDLALWIYTGLFLALACIFLVHEKIELNELQSKALVQTPQS
jgi:hypothetical protein